MSPSSRLQRSDCPSNDNRTIHSQSIDVMLSQAVEYFEEILGQCTNQSAEYVDQTDMQSQRKRKKKRRKRKRKHHRRPPLPPIYSQNLDQFGSTFYCRRALLQNPNGTVFFGVRKR